MAAYPTPWDRFDPQWRTTGTYSRRDALALALACQLAYETKATERRRRLVSWGFDAGRIETVRIRKKPDIDLTALVAMCDDATLIAFRGSASIANWLANLQGVLDPGPFADTSVHEGFQDTLFPGVLALSRVLTQGRFADRPVWITGHSLGGALAVLFAGMLREQGLPVTGVYTFAAPRVGNRRFAERMKANLEGPLFRVVNENDLVPHLPPEPFFTHFGGRRLLKADLDETATADLRFWTRIRRDFMDWFDKITDDEIVVAEAHRLSTEEGYFPRLERDLDGH